MIERISGRDAFRRFRTDGVRARSGPLTVVGIQLARREHPAVAFALSRKVGSAVVRNRLRRQLRVVFRELQAAGDLPVAGYLVIVHPEAKGQPMTTLRGHAGCAITLLTEKSLRGTAGSQRSPR